MYAFYNVHVHVLYSDYYTCTCMIHTIIKIIVGNFRGRNVHRFYGFGAISERFLCEN